MVCTVISFFGIINVGEAHCDDDCLFSTPILSSLFISFSLEWLCVFVVWDMACHDMA
jgi:hypothetical protein